MVVSTVSFIPRWFSSSQLAVSTHAIFANIMGRDVFLGWSSKWLSMLLVHIIDLSKSPNRLGFRLSRIAPWSLALSVCSFTIQRTVTREDTVESRGCTRRIVHPPLFSRAKAFRISSRLRVYLECFNKMPRSTEPLRWLVWLMQMLLSLEDTTATYRTCGCLQPMRLLSIVEPAFQDACL